MKKFYFAVVILCIAAVLITCRRREPVVVDEWANTWDLYWEDNFDSGTLNTAYWNYELGCTGWGNNEWEEYTNSAENVYIENGALVIEAKGNTYGGQCDFTSARLTTKGKVENTYGYIEARIKLPYSKGIWPS